MSKRFGRNQRRHMRDEIATSREMLSEAMNRSAARGREVAELKHRLTSWAGDIAQLLGPESAFNEQVMRREIRDMRALGGALRMLPPVRLSAPLLGPDEVPQFAEVGSVIEAAIYLARVDGDEAGRMRGQIRIFLESRNGDVAYAMNDDRHRRWSPRDIEYMSQMIALEMAKHLREQAA